MRCTFLTMFGPPQQISAGVDDGRFPKRATRMHCPGTSNFCKASQIREAPQRTCVRTRTCSFACVWGGGGERCKNMCSNSSVALRGLEKGSYSARSISLNFIEQVLFQTNFSINTMSTENKNEGPLRGKKRAHMYQVLLISIELFQCQNDGIYSQYQQRPICNI